VSSDNAELVRNIHAGIPEDMVAAFKDESFVVALRENWDSLFHSDFEFTLNTPASFGLAQDYSGMEGFVEGWRDWLAPYVSYRIEPLEFVGAGDRVLVPVRVVAKTSRGDVEVEHRPAAVWTLRDGKVRRLDLFLEVDDARAAAGVA
jgi:ketosteroid isomerase-like protein